MASLLAVVTLLGFGGGILGGELIIPGPVGSKGSGVVLRGGTPRRFITPTPAILGVTADRLCLLANFNTGAPREVEVVESQVRDVPGSGAADHDVYPRLGIDTSFLEGPAPLLADLAVPEGVVVAAQRAGMDGGLPEEPTQRERRIRLGE